MQYNHAIAKLKMPKRIAALPIDARGYPVPRFVSWIDGKPDFRVADGRHLVRAASAKLCWICGQPLGKYMVFVIGPMCAINRVSSEPPSHYDCAHFAVRACPFMVHPQRSRNDSDLPEEGELPAGIMVERNPGVTLLWTTETYRVERHQRGLLFKIGDPHKTEWFARGRMATRDEVMESINTGLPLLRDMAESQGPDAVAELNKQVERGLALVPV